MFSKMKLNLQICLCVNTIFFLLSCFTIVTFLVSSTEWILYFCSSFHFYSTLKVFINPLNYL